MWQLYAFITCAILSLGLIFVNSHLEFVARKLAREGAKDNPVLRVKFKRTHKLIDVCNIVHALAIVGVLVFFVSMLSTVFWGLIFSLTP